MELRVKANHSCSIRQILQQLSRFGGGGECDKAGYFFCIADALHEKSILIGFPRKAAKFENVVCCIFSVEF